MAENTGIEWTNATVNFWWGCTKVGPGCDHCYAETLSNRFGGEHWGVGAPRKKIKGAAKLLHRLDNDYADWAADYHCGLLGPHASDTQRVFIQSMSDIFDTEVPVEWFDEAWTTIEACDRVAPQILTKRVSVVEKRLAAIGRTTWPRHAGLMITVVNQDEADRDIPRLLALKAKLGIPWVGLSVEPLLGPINLYRTYIDTGRHFRGEADIGPFAKLDWVITGAESGFHARPAHPQWFRNIRDDCKRHGVAYFHKQNGAFRHAAYSVSKHTALWTDGGTGSGITIGAPPHDPRKVHQWPDGTMSIRVGVEKAGRLLDGVEWNQFPEVRP